ncbi:MAG: metallopeptidase family protein [Dehalococcoidia bacterium]|nr:metallopeptidase family protein [Dehalococcoidia bacterium]
MTGASRTDRDERPGRRRFEVLVGRALRRLPGPIRDRLSNVALVVEEEPTPAQLAEAGVGPGSTLLGLYTGIPLTERTTNYGMVLPDRIIIFRRPILEMCRTEEELMDQVRRTVLHEIGHHFGLNEAELAGF